LEFCHGNVSFCPARDPASDRLCPLARPPQPTVLPWDIQQDRRALSVWIDAQARVTPAANNDPRPSSKQVAFAEKLARIKRRAVPDECFRDKGLMSKWIDVNK